MAGYRASSLSLSGAPVLLRAHKAACTAMGGMAVIQQLIETLIVCHICASFLILRQWAYQLANSAITA